MAGYDDLYTTDYLLVSVTASDVAGKYKGTNKHDDK